MGFKLFTIVSLFSIGSCNGNRNSKTDEVINDKEFFIAAYGTNYTEAGLYGCQTSDSGFVLTGVTTAYTLGQEALRVIKVDKFGNIQWEATYGTESIESGYSIIETANHQYVICGHSGLYGETDHDVLLLRIDNRGNLLWSKLMGGDDYDYGTDVLELIDGSLILAGYSYSYGSGKDDLFLAKFSADGDSLWTKIYGGLLNEHGYSVEHTSDNGFILVGFTKSFNNNFYRNVPIDPIQNPDECFYDVYVIKTDSVGDTLWTRTYGGNGHDRGQSVQETKDSCYIITGHSTGFDDESDILLLKINTDGKLLWSKIYSTKYIDASYAVSETADGGFIITGETGYNEEGILRTAGLLIRTNSLGELLWSKKVIMDGGNTILYNGGITFNSGYFAVGKTLLKHDEAFDLIFLSLDSNGNTSSNLPTSDIACKSVELDAHFTTTIISAGLDFKKHLLKRDVVDCESFFFNLP